TPDKKPDVAETPPREERPVAPPREDGEARFKREFQSLVEASERMERELANEHPDVARAVDKIRLWWTNEPPPDFSLEVSGGLDWVAFAWNDPDRFRTLCQAEKLQKFLRGDNPPGQDQEKKPLSPLAREYRDRLNWKSAQWV